MFWRLKKYWETLAMMTRQLVEGNTEIAIEMFVQETPIYALLKTLKQQQYSLQDTETRLTHQHTKISQSKRCAHPRNCGTTIDRTGATKIAAVCEKYYQ